MSGHPDRIKLLRHKLLVAGVGVATVLGGLTLAGPVGAEPKPTLEEVKTRVEELHDEASEANERHNAAAETLAEIQRRITAAQADVVRQDARVRELTSDMGGFAAAAYRSGGLDPTIRAMFSGDPDDFLAQASVIDAYAAQQAEQLGVVATERRQLEQKKLVADEERARQEAIKAVMAAEKKKVDDLLAEQEALLAKLTAEEKARLELERERARQAALAERGEAAERISRGSGSGSDAPVVDVPASGRAGVAVQAAMSKLGYPYVYGGKGPNSFDCSGFTSWAWRQAGVSLSPSSRVQAGQGTRVSSSQLRPGDILFYGSPVSHVAMYIGGGKVIHASNPRTDVTIAPAFQAGGSRKPFAGAMRPG
ncbi:MAG: NlpC/P60 family protein [Jiangellaceae bacterium]